MKLGSTFQGAVDVFENNIVRGWAVDHRDRSRPTRVDLYIDCERIGSFSADQPRPDLAHISPESQAKGFSIAVRHDTTRVIKPRIDIHFHNSSERVPANSVASRTVNRPYIDMQSSINAMYCNLLPTPPAESVRYITGLAQSDEEQRKSYLYSGLVNSVDLYNIMLDLGADCRASGYTIFDIGCGSGRYAPYLKQFLPNCVYHGFDIVPTLIDWAKDHISLSFPDCHFSLLADIGKYAGQSAHKMPAESSSAQFIMAMSLFTHLDFDSSAAYFHEMRRLLAPNAHAAVTFRILDESTLAQAKLAIERSKLPLQETEYTWAYGKDGYLDIFYTLPALKKLADAAGLQIVAIRRGSWSKPGTVVNPAAHQDLVMMQAK
jgi:SAM-dependent methyltransferase